MAFRSKLLSLLGAALVPLQLHAFSYAEHCRISNAAFLAAATPYLSSSARASSALNSNNNTDSLSRTARGARVRRLSDVVAELTNRARCAGFRKFSRSYGDIVARVDAASSPNDFFVGRSNPLALGQMGADSIPWETIDRLSASTMQRLSAMHANQDHFGDRALFAFVFWHRAALESAASGRIRTALIINAFADHYLEDLYAPGHVRTVRRGLTDVASMGLHNQFNRAGARYTLSNLDSLIRYLPVASEQIGLAARCVGKRESECRAAMRSECSELNWQRCLKSVADTGLMLYGDHQLKESPTAELFVSMVVARSIDDVLTAYLESNANVDHFGDRVYWSRARSLGIRREGAMFSTPFGRYERDTVGIWSDVDRAPTVVLGMQSFLSSPKRRARVGVETMALPWLGENFTIPADSLEWVNPKGLSRFGLTAGVDAVFGDATFAAGPYADVVWSLPELNSQIRSGFGWRYSTDRALKGSKAVHGSVRWELGFGLLTTGLALEMEPIVGVGGVVTREISLGTSIHATIPIRRHKRK